MYVCIMYIIYCIYSFYTINTDIFHIKEICILTSHCYYSNCTHNSLFIHSLITLVLNTTINL